MTPASKLREHCVLPDVCEVLHLPPPAVQGAEAQDDRWCRTFSTEQDYARLMPRDLNWCAYKPDGTILALVIRRAIDAQALWTAYKALKGFSQRTDLRATASGMHTQHDVKADGTVSNTSRINRRIKDLPISGVLGYMDRFARIPYCRKTAFTRDNPEQVAATVPVLREMDRIYAHHMPERYAGQLEAVQSTHEDWRIADTVYTTVTVNRNWRTAYHRDSGDLIEPGKGISCLTAMWGGKGEGANLVFPAWGIATELRTGDVILMDSHEIHGNTPIVGRHGAYQRVSLVAYYRTGMGVCGSSQQEFERAKRVNTERANKKRGTK